jgi:hypothetical protein
MPKRYSYHGFLACFLALISFFAVFSTPALADDGKENLVKAAYMFNFIKFTEWSDGKAISKQSKIDICVIGDSSIIKTAQVFSQASSPKLTISLVSEQNIRNVATHCHMLFIAASEENRLAEILAVIKNQPVLTISDGDGFAERGVMIGFVKSDERIKLEVNKHSAENAGLKIDAQLLEIALRVIDK